MRHIPLDARCSRADGVIRQLDRKHRVTADSAGRAELMRATTFAVSRTRPRQRHHPASTCRPRAVPAQRLSRICVTVRYPALRNSIGTLFSTTPSTSGGACSQACLHQCLGPMPRHQAMREPRRRKVVAALAVNRSSEDLGLGILLLYFPRRRVEYAESGMTMALSSIRQIVLRPKANFPIY